MYAAPPPNSDRGQTTQDYAVGIGLFLLVVLFTVTFIPSILAGFGAVDDAERSAQAERVATMVVSDSAIEGERVHLDIDKLETNLGDLNDPEAFGLPGHLSINATLTNFDETQVYSGGPDYQGQRAGTWTRIVTMNDGDEPDNCAEGCRLVIRVW